MSDIKDFFRPISYWKRLRVAYLSGIGKLKLSTFLHKNLKERCCYSCLLGHRNESHLNTVRQRRGDLDGIRAIAVISILLFHAGIASVPGGYVGVDIFFVLSGFLITHLIVKDIASHQFAISSFYARRLSRLLPAALMTIVVTMLLAVVLMPPPMLDGIRTSAVASVFYVSNIFFWLDSGYFSDDAITKPLLHMWSLSVEEQFYLVYPFILWGAFRIGGIRFIRNTVLAMTVLSFILCLFLTHYFPSSAYFLMPSRFWQLGTGALLVLLNIADLENRPTRSKAPFIAGMISVVLILISVFLYGEDTPFPGYAALLPVLSTAILIWSSSRSPSIRNTLSLFPLVFIGKISYSLYLVHWPIVVFMFALGGTPGTFTFAAICLFISFVSACALYYFIERPFMRLRKLGNSLVLWKTGQYATAVLVLCYAIPMIGLPTLTTKDPVLQSLQFSVAESGRQVQCDYTKNKLCFFGKGASQARLAFVGDSHALMIKGAAKTIARELNIDVLVLYLGPFCPPFSEIEIYTKSRKVNTGCQKRRAGLFEKLKSIGIEEVVLVGRWRAYARPMPNVSLSPEVMSDTDKNAMRKRFLGAVKNTAKLINSMGMNVRFMEQVPETSCHAKKVLTQAATLADFDDKCPFLSREKVKMQMGMSLADIREIPLDIVHTQPAYCNDKLCKAYDDRKMLYDDDNHLTFSGSQVLASYWLSKDILVDLVN